MSNAKTYIADRIFTGNEMLQQHAIIVKDDVIVEIISSQNISENSEIIRYKNALIAPAFIDLQIYGAYKKLLAVYPNKESVQAIHDYSKAGGCSHCMPTVATNTYETIFKCIDAIKDYWNAGGKGVLGLHVEGPWMSKEKRGVHNADWIFSPTVEQAKELLEYGKDVIKIITLAPEVCDKEVIDLVHSYGIVVSAGHSNATFEQANESFKTIKTATHLFNAMSGFQHRALGMVGAVFEHPTVYCSLVADGYHVSFPAIRIAKKLMGDRLFAITDAVTETHEGFYLHVLNGEMYTSNNVLSGSALTMQKAFKNLVQQCNISEDEALRMCSLYPAKVMNKENELGLIAIGRKQNFIVINKDLDVIETITG